MDRLRVAAVATHNNNNHATAAATAASNSMSPKAKSKSSMAAAVSSRLYSKNGASNSSMLGSRRIKKKKREELARIIDDRGRDVTPLALSHTLTAQLAAMSALNHAYSSSGNSVHEAPSSFSSSACSASFAPYQPNHLQSAFSTFSSTAADVTPQSDASSSMHTSADSSLLKRTHSLGLGMSTFMADDEERMLGSSSISSTQNTQQVANSVLDASLRNNHNVADARLTTKVQTPYDGFALSQPERATVVIAETATVTLFSLPSLRVSDADTALSAQMRAENQAYAELREKKKEKDKFSTGFAQTINPSERDKGCQCSPPVIHDSFIQASAWMIFDEMSKQNQEDEVVQQYEQNEEAGSSALVRRDQFVQRSHEAEDKEDDALFAHDSDTGAAASQHRGVGTRALNANDSSSSDSMGSSTASLDSGRSSANTSQSATGISQLRIGAGVSTSAVVSAIPQRLSPQLSKLYALPSFQVALRAVEHAVLQNVYHREQALYRDGDAAAASLLSIDLEHGDHASLLIAKEKSRLSTLFRFVFAAANHVVEPSAAPLPLASASLIQLSPLTSKSATMSSLSQLLSGSVAVSSASPSPAALPVTCVAFNRANPDLLAVGYGTHQFGVHQAGRIAYWSSKNPAHPHQWLHTSSSVLACEFSRESPHLLAVGMASGLVAVYDVRSSGGPLMEASHSSGKHRSCVWQVHWVGRDASIGSTRAELLVSVSQDGTVRQWHMKKGLVPKELMTLKRNINSVHVITGNTSKLVTGTAKGKSLNLSEEPSAAASSSTTVSLDGLSRDACGLCFDFAPWDLSQYFAGTEDGWIHQCSVSYNEQTLDTFAAHTGPVYAVRCSPFASDLLLSCSADWTCALWSANRSRSVPGASAAITTNANAAAPAANSNIYGLTGATPVLRFQCGFDEILDCVWHPHLPTVFASVSREGRVDLWDLEQSTLDPISVVDLARNGQCISFAPNGHCLLVGDADGGVSVLRIEGLHDKSPLSRLEDIVSASFQRSGS